ncbi:hypothetical protein TNCV_3881721 [Trichonephila clavipes]|nr:hypothetical protein TNCV_3881721 [Trichonephila clavipes]
MLSFAAVLAIKIQCMGSVQQVGVRDMGHSISEIAMKFGFSRTTTSRVNREYIGNPVKYQVSDIAAAGKRS